jgi:hypothetical protein
VCPSVGGEAALAPTAGGGEAVPVPTAPRHDEAIHAATRPSAARPRYGGAAVCGGVTVCGGTGEHYKNGALMVLYMTFFLCSKKSS